ncbi:MAG TPA: glycoside hydrolase/phage tail family protein, partial [Alphaproteobacteria bacterium]|nr:glycoside hydrolase/phage tail family protein [Alphaproteobacteria bacterium]
IKISYGADWSEYFGHQPQDGSHDAIFHLDPLWSDSNIDAVAIDLYHPLSDWRSGVLHADYLAGFHNVHDRGYLQTNVEGGEGHTWYYASSADRDAQTRTAITDGAYSKPWVFRYKDIRSWWSNYHYDRPGGVESTSHTGWAPQSKPIWFSEVGCPAIDKGANQPNLFFDAKSSESGLPYFSNGDRDDLMQRRYLEAVLGYWRVAAGNNPTSSVYGASMIDTSHAFCWTWDARPYPDFPVRTLVWSDGPNWRCGHWLNGRIGAVPLNELVTELAGTDADIVDTSALSGLVTGYIIDTPMSARSAIEPLAAAYHFDAVESEGLIVFRDRADAAETAIAKDNLSADDQNPPYAVTRAQESELPAAARLSYVEVDAEYRVAAVESHKLTGASDRVLDTVAPLVMEQSDAQSIADTMLQAAWAGRETAKFKLPPSQLALDPGDVVDLVTPTRTFRLQITQLNDGADREVQAVSIDKSVYAAPPGPFRTADLKPVVSFGRGVIYFLDIPLLPGSVDGEAGYVAIGASPWPGKEALYKSTTTSGYSLQTLVARPAISGVLLSPLYSGPKDRWDDGNTIWLQVFSGGLASAEAIDVLGGANACAVQNADGEWEVIQFTQADVTGPDQYLLKTLLRGQLGTEGAMRNPVAAGAPFVLLDEAIVGIGLNDAEAGLSLNYQFGPAQKSLGDPSYVSASHTFALVPSRCYAPTQVRGVKAASGDIAITWIRRTRIGGDDWDQVEVPLGEASEAYEVDIYNVSGAVIRTLSATTGAATYAAAQVTADFGGPPPSPLNVAVYQLSATRGRGSPANQALYL